MKDRRRIVRMSRRLGRAGRRGFTISFLSIATAIVCPFLGGGGEGMAPAAMAFPFVATGGRDVRRSSSSARSRRGVQWHCEHHRRSSRSSTPPSPPLFAHSSWRRPTPFATASSPLFSSLGGGGGGDDNDDGNNGYGSKGGSPLDDWINIGRDGKGGGDDEMRRLAREEVAESRLPISYGVVRKDDEGNFGPLGGDDDGGDDEQGQRSGGGMEDGTYSDATIIEGDDADDAIGSAQGGMKGGALARMPSSESDKNNPYLTVVSRLSPSDLISRFTSTASPRVQDAVRTTILGLIGGLPQMAFETKTVATGERLASLMFQLQMTGYMFKNAEYRLSLSQSLGGGGSSAKNLLAGEVGQRPSEGRMIEGKIKVRYGGGSTTTNDADDAKTSISDDDSDDEIIPAEASDDASEKAAIPAGMEIEVDAAAYMSELSNEVSKLKSELESTRQAKEEEVRKDLLRYIRTLPQQELRGLTGTMSPEVLDAMKGLVNAVLSGIGGEEAEKAAKENGIGNNGEVSATSSSGEAYEKVTGAESTVDGDDVGEGGEEGPKIGPDTVTEQSGEALAQLCMWQLVVGYNLRELEVREEFQESLKNSGSSSGLSEDDSGVDLGPGALE